MAKTERPLTTNLRAPVNNAQHPEQVERRVRLGMENAEKGY